MLQVEMDGNIEVVDLYKLQVNQIIILLMRKSKKSALNLQQKLQVIT